MTKIPMLKLRLFFLGLLLISMAGLVAWAVINPRALAADDLSPAQLSARTTAFANLAGLLLVAVMVSAIGFFAARDLENALLRRWGQSATATVLAVRDTHERDNGRRVKRIKLAVQPPHGAPFEAVAEDILSSLEIGPVSPGTAVAVKYDPRTREVALESFKSPKTKRPKADNF